MKFIKSQASIFILFDGSGENKSVSSNLFTDIDFHNILQLYASLTFCNNQT
ncbi:MAG: hypothetical protein Q8S84_03360 [bacterium]|nr:hypothetical protein [bacterium]MDP3380563.1 hypothetical protein [bacterium]